MEVVVEKQCSATDTASDQSIDETKLRIALMESDAESLEQIFSKGCDVDIKLSTGWTALMYAAQYASADCIAFLLNHGANPNYDRDSYTVLMCACSARNDESKVFDCVSKLLKAGCDVNCCDRNKGTALMCTAREDYATVAELLIKNEALLNVQDIRGYTALMWAVVLNHISVVRLLVGNGTDVNLKRDDGKTAVHLAAEGKSEEIIEIFKKVIGDHEAFAHSPTTTSTSNRSRTVLLSDQLRLSRANYDISSNTSTVLSTQNWESKNPKPATQKTHADNKSDMIDTCSELDLFLRGINLGHLLPLFVKSDVDFQTLVTLSCSDLHERCGISDEKDRQKILSAVNTIHKRNWQQTASRKTIQYSRKITCSDAIAMLSNIKKHMAYVVSIVGYVSDQLIRDKQIVLDPPEGTKVEDLLSNTDEASDSLAQLYNELVELRHRLGEVCQMEPFQAPALIDLKSGKKRRRKLNRKRLLLVASLSAVIGGIIFVAAG